MMWFVSRRRHEQELAAAQTEIAALRRRVLATEERHDEVVRAYNKLAEELAATSVVNDCLTADLTAARERLAEYGSRRTSEDAAEWRASYEAEKRRADRLQERLDDACGLGPDGIEDSGQWQPGFKPKPKPVGGVS